jgi:hypothetical protein
LKRFETLRTWLIIIGLLVFSGLAAAIWPLLQAEIAPIFDFSLGGGITGASNTITIQLEDYLLGEVLVGLPLISELNGVEINSLLLAAIITAIVGGAVVALGLPLAFIYTRLDKTTENVKQDPDFQEHRSNLEQKEKARLKELEESHPPAGAHEHVMPRWSVIATSLVVVFFVFIIGLALGDTFVPSGEMSLFGLSLIDPSILIGGVSALVAALVLAAAYGGRTPDRADDYSGVPWGMIWVIVSGLVFIGLGMGLMMWVRAGGG